mmetsp:Transcript_37139/g.74964  ORF Transcript_37139/g.74964 Transcript_37139/m.74964 type:complete len:155 (-) Transcript_37139:353-817(-)
MAGAEELAGGGCLEALGLGACCGGVCNCLCCGDPEKTCEMCCAGCTLETLGLAGCCEGCCTCCCGEGDGPGCCISILEACGAAACCEALGCLACCACCCPCCCRPRKEAGPEMGAPAYPTQPMGPPMYPGQPMGPPMYPPPPQMMGYPVGEYRY